VTDQCRLILRSTAIGECDNADKRLFAVQYRQPATAAYCARTLIDMRESDFSEGDTGRTRLPASTAASR
jgi:hypothetical protein